MRICPLRKVTPAFEIALGSRVAVGEQVGVLRLVRFYAHEERCEHVWSVWIVGDAAEAFGLALRAEATAGNIEAGQLGICLWRNAGFDFEPEGIAGAEHGQAFFVGHVVVDAERHAVQLDGSQRKLLAIESQRRAIRTGLRHAEFGHHARFGGVQAEEHPHAIYAEREGLVVR